MNLGSGSRQGTKSGCPFRQGSTMDQRLFSCRWRLLYGELLRRNIAFHDHTSDYERRAAPHRLRLQASSVWTPWKKVMYEASGRAMIVLTVVVIDVGITSSMTRTTKCWPACVHEGFPGLSQCKLELQTLMPSILI